ncbi:hypothetical protein [Commensalibacter oyaizuii]|uniref:Colicin V synthesis protein n=1 Tax=Commensalibacter oyaizuii TaxID=3043873 RepID=A0ABT6Q447_9PROT|nr:hypothetical protein [Commensalibacter sp. TBRC 16381]MDI2091891.1 hypothetical protein [Commensalibacter sp. TBRC 16381]
MRDLNNVEISNVSGAGLLGALNFGVTAGWAGLILGGKYGGSNGGILGFGLIGNLVGLIAGGILGAAGGAVVGLANSDTQANAWSQQVISFITSGTILGQNNI